MVAARPFETLDSALARSDEVLADLAWPDVLAALAAHPRIGDRAAGPSREATWSRQEQAGAANVAGDVRAALHDGNIAYEERFGHVFLIRASGRTAAEMLAALTERLGHDEATEQDVVRRELAAIVHGRLEKTLR
jgi:2-oxo-4-hydroxy-4-carboxy-5-ureidoimidazoline decarboxylase